MLINALLLLTVQAQPSLLPTSHYKYQVVRQVCQQLAVSFGERRLPQLTIISDPKSQRIAQFVPKPEPELFLDEKMYDLCREFEADSLAALSIVLGHELSHYYEKHADWFGFAQLLNQQKPSPAQYEQTQVLEAQADMLGAYHAFLAGYAVYPISKRLYTAIYDRYHLPNQMPGYPSRTQRIHIMDDQSAKASTLGMAFEVGVFFLLNQRYVSARRCFEFVLEELPTRELLNNVGLCHLLTATQAMSLREMPFRYPFTMATNNRLRPDDNRGNEADKADLLKKAISYFRQAIDLDKTYETAYINQASALSLLGRNGSAKEIIDDLDDVLRQFNKSLPDNARLVRGIALTQLGKPSEATADLLRSVGAYELAYNQAVSQQYDKLQTVDPAMAISILKALADQQAKPASDVTLQAENRLGSVSLPLSNTITYTERLVIPEPDLVRIQGSRNQNGMLYRVVLSDTVFDIVRSYSYSAKQSSRGIQTGSSVQALITQYGEPQRTVSAGNGLSYYCYDSARFFVAVQDSTVRNWIIYFSHKP